MPCGCSNGTTVQVVCNQTCTTLTPTVCQNQSIDITLSTGCTNNVVYNILSGPTNGTATVDTINKRIVYVPNTDYVGGDQIKVEVYCDGDLCEQYLINITVKEVLADGQCLITLSGAGATCQIGDPNYMWSGFILGVIELHPESLPTDETIKVIVNCYHETANPNPTSADITLKVCCNPCENNCCKEVVYEWRPPIGVPDDCTMGDCSNHPCTVFDPTTGNCVTQCTADCTQCCEQTTVTFNHDTGGNFTPTITGNNYSYTHLVTVGGESLTFAVPVPIVVGGVNVDNAIWVPQLENAIQSVTGAINVTITATALTTSISVTGSNSQLSLIVLADIDASVSNTFNFTLLGTNNTDISFCAECCNNGDCVGDQICLNGTCVCPDGSQPQADGTCPECTTDADCPNCETCETQSGTCVPFECPPGQIQMPTGDNTCVCVECIQNTDCDFPCEECDQTTNTCVPAPTSCEDPITGVCIPCPPCGLVTHPNGTTEFITCPDPCEYCNNNQCVPTPCQAGLIPNPNDPTTGSITIGGITIECGDGMMNPDGTTNPAPCCCVEDPCISDPISATSCLTFDIDMRHSGFTTTSTDAAPELIFGLNWQPDITSGTPNLNGLWKDGTEQVMLNPFTTGNLPVGTNVEWEINFTKFVDGWISIPEVDTVPTTGYHGNGDTGVHISNFIVGDGYLLRARVLGRTITKEFWYDENTQVVTSRNVGTSCICIVKSNPQTWFTVNSVIFDTTGTGAELTYPLIGGQSDHLVFNRPSGNTPVTAIVEVSYTNSLGMICTNNLTVVLEPCVGGCCGVQSIICDETFDSATQKWVLHASVLGEDCEGNPTTTLYTCATPSLFATPGDNSEQTVINTIAFDSGGTGNPVGYSAANADNCGTLPNSNMTVDQLVGQCGPFPCNTNTNSPQPTAPCGWVTRDVRIDYLNGSNIELTIDGQNPAVCFGVNTLCGYVCRCKSFIQPPEPCTSTIRVGVDTTLLCSNDTFEICLTVPGTGLLDFSSLIWTGATPISQDGSCFTFTIPNVSQTGITIGVSGNIIENGLTCPFQATEIISPNCPTCTLTFGSHTYDCDTNMLTVPVNGGCTNSVGQVISTLISYTYSYGTVTGTGTTTPGGVITLPNIPANTQVVINATTICDIDCQAQLILTTDDCITCNINVGFTAPCVGNTIEVVDVTVTGSIGAGDSYQIQITDGFGNSIASNTNSPVLGITLPIPLTTPLVGGGTINVRVVTTDGCDVTESIAVDCINPCATTMNSTFDCANTVVNEIITTVSGFTPPVVIQIFNGAVLLNQLNTGVNEANSQFITAFGLTTGTLTITATGANNCSQTIELPVDCSAGVNKPVITSPDVTTPTGTRFTYIPTQTFNTPFGISTGAVSTSPLSLNRNLVNRMLKNKANVLGYSLGYKKVNGKFTGEKAIVVSVSKKEKVSAKDMIPKKIGKFITDVIERQPADALYTSCNCDLNDRATTNCICDGVNTGNSCTCLPHRDKFRVTTSGSNFNKELLIGGISGMVSPGSACTTTIVARDTIDNSLVLLACNHCAGCANSVNPNNGVGLNYVQPSPFDGSSTRVGRIKRGYVVDGGTLNKLDAAVIQIDSDVVPMPDVFEIGAGPFNWITRQELMDLYAATPAGQLYLYKSGRTGGTYTPAEQIFVSEIGVSGYSVRTSGCYNVRDWTGDGIPDGAVFDDIIIASQSTTGYNAGYPGDSSSPIMIVHNNEIKLLGILFAGDDDSIGICPAYNLNLLNVEAWDGTIVVESTDATITVAGRTFNRVAETTLPITHVKD